MWREPNARSSTTIGRSSSPRTARHRARARRHPDSGGRALRQRYRRGRARVHGLSDARPPERRLPMRGGIAWLDGESLKRFDRRFVECEPSERTTLLDVISYPDRAPAESSPGVEFMNRFRDLTATGFFSSKIGSKTWEYRGNEHVTEWDRLSRRGASKTRCDLVPRPSNSSHKSRALLRAGIVPDSSKISRYGFVVTPRQRTK